MNSWLNAMDFKSMKHKIRSDTMINDVSSGHNLNEKCQDFFFFYATIEIDKNGFMCPRLMLHFLLQSLVGFLSNISNH